ncbi:unnamed protein product [Nyctereutes procyonoides]|uniref:(raccoon dog) hypothetical protein n=1 Tax=Nyctereutes procyonoides TaxID=34880 RepID=A0A811Y537_NYCPR|nr:unnamed protein product [Nyctereutes procyonoides]
MPILLLSEPTSCCGNRDLLLPNHKFVATPKEPLTGTIALSALTVCPRRLTSPDISAHSSVAWAPLRPAGPLHRRGSKRPDIFKGTSPQPLLGLSQGGAYMGTPNQHAHCTSAPEQTPPPLLPCWAGTMYGTFLLGPADSLPHGEGHGPDSTPLASLRRLLLMC